ncbi:MAG: hypothetical protein ACYC7A_18215 [Thermoanaerobaculia bacterium]
MSVFNCSACGLTLQYDAVDEVADFERYLELWTARHCIQCPKPARENRWSLPSPADCGPVLTRLLDPRPMTDEEAGDLLRSRDDLRLRLQCLKGRYGDDPVFVAAAKYALERETSWIEVLVARTPAIGARALRLATRFASLD